MALERGFILGVLWLEHIFGVEKLPVAVFRVRAWAEANLLKRLQARGVLGQSTEIASVRPDEISPAEFFEQYLKQNRPVVFKGAALNWPSCKRWNLDFLDRGYGSTEVLLPDFLSEQRSQGVEETTLQAVVKNIRAGGKKYLRFSPLAAHSINLSNDLDIGWIKSHMPARSIGNIYYLFAGGPGTSTPLHSDQPCNLYVQVSGRKKWILISPRQSHLTYSSGTQSAYLGSRAQMKKSDQWPLLNYADKIESTLEAGDILYVPPHFWHYVENESETIAVAFRFSSLRESLRSSLWLCFVRLFASRPFIWQTGRLGRIDTNLIMALENRQADLVRRWVQRASSTDDAGPSASN